MSEHDSTRAHSATAPVGTSQGDEIELARSTATDAEDAARRAAWLIINRAPPAKVYHVPTRFGMSGILGITTLTALVFGGIHSLAAITGRGIDGQESTGNPFLYTWLGMLIFATCLVQMKYGTQPRSASIGIGALLLPVVSLGAAAIEGEYFGADMLFLCLPMLALFGALTGYLAGALTAGTFLVVDKLERWFQRPPRPQRCVLFDSQPSDVPATSQVPTPTGHASATEPR